jgi:hypothetical protein
LSTIYISFSLLVVSQPDTGSKIINCLLSAQIKQENAEREYNDILFFLNFAPRAFPSALSSFSTSPKINKKSKAGSFFRQAFFVAFAKLVKVA